MITTKLLEQISLLLAALSLAGMSGVIMLHWFSDIYVESHIVEVIALLMIMAGFILTLIEIKERF